MCSVCARSARPARAAPTSAAACAAAFWPSNRIGCGRECDGPQGPGQERAVPALCRARSVLVATSSGAHSRASNRPCSCSTSFARHASATGIVRDPLITDSDRGSNQQLGIARSLSWPRVSSSDPYSESLFKTTKYAPTYPDRFDDHTHAKAWRGPFGQHYNHEDKHEGIAWLTPVMVHDGLASHSSRNDGDDGSRVSTALRALRQRSTARVPAADGSVNQQSGRPNCVRRRNSLIFQPFRLICIGRFRINVREIGGLGCVFVRIHYLVLL